MNIPYGGRATPPDIHAYPIQSLAPVRLELKSIRNRILIALEVKKVIDSCVGKVVALGSKGNAIRIRLCNGL